MGVSASTQAATTQEQKQETKANIIMAKLQNQLECYQIEIKQHEGDNTQDANIQVQGGRAAMTTSQIRMSSSSDVSSEIKAGLDDFFDAAQGFVAGDTNAGITSAINGASSLLDAALDAMFGVSNGQMAEKKSFVCVRMNAVIVRIDYMMCTYSVSAQKWGAEDGSCGVCYIASLSIIPTEKLSTDELSFFITQSLPDGKKTLGNLAKARADLWASLKFSSQISNPTMTPKEFINYLNQTQVAQRQFQNAIKNGTLESTVAADNQARITREYNDKIAAKKNRLGLQEDDDDDMTYLALQ